jgi:hypothetical protein
MPVLLRPNVDTKFHIDLGWWEKSHKDMRVYMQNALCKSCRTDLADVDLDEKLDWVDEETGEVTQVDPLWHTIRACCSDKPEYVTEDTPIIDAIFMTFLSNGNKPLSVSELHEMLDKRPPETILRMLTRGRTYLGIRPVPSWRKRQ